MESLGVVGDLASAEVNVAAFLAGELVLRAGRVGLASTGGDSVGRAGVSAVWAGASGTSTAGAVSGAMGCSTVTTSSNRPAAGPTAECVASEIPLAETDDMSTSGNARCFVAGTLSDFGAMAEIKLTKCSMSK